MKRLVIFALLFVFAWQGYGKYQAHSQASADTEPIADITQTPPTAASNIYRCDGRTYCSQMTSCEEATFFLKNCPGVKMDGNNDGIPCEKQWCN